MTEQIEMRQKAFQAGLECIDEYGYDCLDLREVAKRMQVFYGSFQALIRDDEEHYRFQLANYVIEHYHGYMKASFAGKSREEAVYAFANAYMAYCRKHRKVFDYLMTLPERYKGKLPHFEFLFEEPYECLLDGFDLCQQDRQQCICLLRSILSGLFLQFNTPFFLHTGLWFEDALRFALDHFLTVVRTCEETGDRPRAV